MTRYISQVTSYEHKLLFNAMQLNNNDEQAAAVRRELENRFARVSSSRHAYDITLNSGHV